MSTPAARDERNERVEAEAVEAVAVAGCDDASGGAPAACGPRVGRPRSAAADQAILDATLDLFADLGFDGVSIEAVAERAGVAKSTVYRRYPTKIDLVMAAWCDCSPMGDGPIDTGSIEGDLLAAAHRLRAVFTESRIGRAVPSALAASARFPEFAEAHRSFVAERRVPAVAAVERAVARGELQPGTDPMLVIDLITGPIFYRALKSGGTLHDADLDAIVTRVVAAFR